VLPKGWIEPGEPAYRGALREAFEEAGLVGEADREPLGTYSYAKRRDGGQPVMVEVRVFRLRVARLLADWPERAERTRRLVRPAAAAAMVAEPELAKLLRGLAGAP
jgi:8-oxo-dGTP pyrophosphatase MutT (NUDIX family)